MGQKHRRVDRGSEARAWLAHVGLTRILLKVKGEDLNQKLKSFPKGKGLAHVPCTQTFLNKA